MTKGILLMTFGSAVTAADVPEYLRSVRGGSDPSEDSILEFQRRYDLVKRSPLLDITGEQAEVLQRLLDGEYGARSFRVAIGMLHLQPSIDTAVAKLAASCSEIIGIILSPQHSDLIMDGYGRAFSDAIVRHAVAGHVAGAWHTLESFHSALAGQLALTLARFDEGVRDAIPIIFTAHSLPQRVVERDPGYVRALYDTARSVAERAGIASSGWQFAYQSAGHGAQDWLKPDFKDLLPSLREAGHFDVIVAPTQFLTDHLEILYDIDIAGQEEANALGMTMHRTPMLNASSRLARTLADVVRRELEDGAGANEVSLIGSAADQSVLSGGN